MDIVLVSKLSDMLSLPHCKVQNWQIHTLCSWQWVGFLSIDPKLLGAKAAENFLCVLLAILLD